MWLNLSFWEIYAIYSNKNEVIIRYKQFKPGKKILSYYKLAARLKTRDIFIL